MRRICLIAAVLLAAGLRPARAAQRVCEPLVEGAVSVRVEAPGPDAVSLRSRVRTKVAGSWTGQDGASRRAGSAAWTETFASAGEYRIEVARDDNVSLSPDGGWEVLACVTVYTATLEVRRKGSGDAFGPSAAVAAGGLDTDVHGAEVRVRTEPAVAGVPIDVRIRPGDERGHVIPASLRIAGRTDVGGTLAGTFTSSDTDGPVTLEARSASGALLGATTVSQNWDDDEGLEFNVPDYFIPGVPGRSTFTCMLNQKTPITGHRMHYYTIRARIRVHRRDLVTGEETEDEIRYVESEDRLPFGLRIGDLVRHSPVTETQPGRYTNDQTVHDYFDIVAENGRECWREAAVLDYSMAIEDDGVYNR